MIVLLLAKKENKEADIASYECLVKLIEKSFLIFFIKSSKIFLHLWYHKEVYFSRKFLTILLKMKIKDKVIR